MDRTTIISELASLKYKGKLIYSSRNKAGTLNRIKKFDDEYLYKYYEYFHKATFDARSFYFKNTYDLHKSILIDFIEFCQTERLYLEHSKFTQANLDQYFSSKNESSEQHNKRKKAVRDFLIRNSIDLDFSEIQRKIEDKKHETEVAEPLTSRQIELIRECYKKDRFKLFAFEWHYTLGMKYYDYESFNSNQFDYDKKTIKVSGDEKPLSEYMTNLIYDIRNCKEVSQKYSIQKSIENMEKELVDKGIVERHFRPLDIDGTIKMDAKKFGTYNYCPEYGRPFESIAENWIIKQYENSDTKWIVCTDCGKVDEN